MLHTPHVSELEAALMNSYDTPITSGSSTTRLPTRQSAPPPSIAEKTMILTRMTIIRNDVPQRRCIREYAAAFSGVSSAPLS